MNTIHRPKPRKREELVQAEAERIINEKQREADKKSMNQNRVRVSSLDRRDVIPEDYDEGSSIDSSNYFRGSLLTPPTFTSRMQILSDEGEDAGDDDDDEEDSFGEFPNLCLDQNPQRRRYSSSSMASSSDYTSDESELEDIGRTMDDSENEVPSGRIIPVREMNLDMSPVPRFVSPGKVANAYTHISIPHPHHVRSSTNSMAYSDDEEEEDIMIPENKKSVGHPRRWLMLFYISSLNLISDWVCYSVAPIATWTEEVYGMGNTEILVVTFLSANVVRIARSAALLLRCTFGGVN